MNSLTREDNTGSSRICQPTDQRCTGWLLPTPNKHRFDLQYRKVKHTKLQLCHQALFRITIQAWPNPTVFLVLYLLRKTVLRQNTAINPIYQGYKLKKTINSRAWLPGWPANPPADFRDRMSRPTSVADTPSARRHQPHRSNDPPLRRLHKSPPDVLAR